MYGCSPSHLPCCSLNCCLTCQSSCWVQGLFSLGIPGRVGYQCSAQYRKQGGGQQESARATAAHIVACQVHHAEQVAEIWAKSSVQR
jgi:hypothetical protein